MYIYSHFANLQNNYKSMDLTKAIMPCHVVVDGMYITIHTEHFYWLRFSQIIKQDEITFDDLKHFLQDDIENVNVQNLFNALLEFYSKKPMLPRNTGSGNSRRVLDYTIDANLIYSAFMQCYKIDLIETPLHWHKFLALIEGLHRTALNDVMGYRAYKGKDREFIKLRNAWELPEEDDVDGAEEAQASWNALFS